MKHMIMQNKFLPIFALSIHLLLSIRSVSSQPFPGQKYEVRIISNIKNSNSPLLVHCASKDDNLGDHTLRENNDFHWDFKVNVLLTTLYYCRFQWNSKEITFDVFKKSIAPYCSSRCVWVVREDGFWISGQLPPAQTLEQLHKWP